MPPSAGPLDTELKFFAQHVEEWERQNQGKLALVKGERLLGFFDTTEAAYQAGLAELGNVPMLVRQVLHAQPAHSLPALLHGVL